MQTKLSNYNFQLSTINSQFNSGFTLIELMVVISISLIIGGIGIASFVSLSTKQDLDKAANDLKLTIDEARFSTASNVKPNIPQPSITPGGSGGAPSNCFDTDNSINNRVLNGYRIELNPPTNTYSIIAECGFDQPPTPIDIPIRTVTLPAGITMSVAQGRCTKFRFTVLTNDISCLSGAGSALGTTLSTITLSKTGTPNRVITVTTSGFSSVN